MKPAKALYGTVSMCAFGQKSPKAITFITNAIYFFTSVKETMLQFLSTGLEESCCHVYGTKLKDATGRESGKSLFKNRIQLEFIAK